MLYQICVHHRVIEKVVDRIVHVRISSFGQCRSLRGSLAEHSLIIVGPPCSIVEDEVVVAPPAGLQLVVRGHGCQCSLGRMIDRPPLFIARLKGSREPRPDMRLPLRGALFRSHDRITRSDLDLNKSNPRKL